VQDAHQGRGVASALLEHIAAVARERGIRRFTAEVLPANTKMIKVFTDAGYQQKRSFEDGVVRLEFGLEPTDRSLAVQHAREQRAEARSVQRLLAPGSVAVVGVGRTLGGGGGGHAPVVDPVVAHGGDELPADRHGQPHPVDVVVVGEAAHVLGREARVRGEEPVVL
ncbi:hypothetical protein ADL27_26190, partial [Streptomyces sp. NRRL F-6602]